MFLWYFCIREHDSWFLRIYFYRVSCPLTHYLTYSQVLPAPAEHKEISRFSGLFMGNIVDIDVFVCILE